ncbi:MAG TPA: NfeD family protein [Mycobacteriales bacterium]|nr:NfeD family protein [Mycobacteriales bacterium]
MDAWMIWLIAAVVLLIAELFSLDLVLAMFSTGALAAAISAASNVELVMQSLVFAGVSILTLVFVRPLALKLLRNTPDPAKTGLEALTGSIATVLKRVDEGGGLVKLRGEEWSAQSYEPGEVFEPGDKVRVVGIKGATALVGRPGLM